MKELKASFDLFDLDGGGTIDLDELVSLVQALGIRCTDAEIYDMLYEEDKAMVGSLNFDDFCRLMERGRQTSYEVF